MSNSLYQLTNEFMEIVSQLEEMELEPETMQDTLDSLQAPIEEKVENIVKYTKSLEALAEAKKAEAKRLSESAASDLKKAEWFKNYMADNLQKAGISKLQAGVFALSFRKGSEVVQIVNEEEIPWTVKVNGIEHEIVKHEPKYNKTEIKKLLKLVDGIPGITLVRNPDTLTIK
jgi:FKBP-type peptidyl-prolyl cis-trans isomerase